MKPKTLHVRISSDNRDKVLAVQGELPVKASTSEIVNGVLRFAWPLWKERFERATNHPPKIHK